MNRIQRFFKELYIYVSDSSANLRIRIGKTDELFQRVDLLLLCFDDLLLFLYRVYQDGCDLLVFHAFDLAIVVAGCEKRLDGVNLLGAETDIRDPAIIPTEIDRPQARRTISRPPTKC